VKRILAAAAAAAAAVLTSACSPAENGEIRYEMTGEAGATADVTRVPPGTDGQPDSVTFPKRALPMSEHASIAKGPFEVYGTPSRGALTCRIVMDGKEVAKQTGAPGQKVSCTAVRTD
jgi:hypothetical protein